MKVLAGIVLLFFVSQAAAFHVEGLKEKQKKDLYECGAVHDTNGEDAGDFLMNCVIFEQRNTGEEIRIKCDNFFYCLGHIWELLTDDDDINLELMIIMAHENLDYLNLDFDDEEALKTNGECLQRFRETRAGTENLDEIKKAIGDGIFCVMSNFMSIVHDKKEKKT